jgi:hypothetical protein
LGTPEIVVRASCPDVSPAWKGLRHAGRKIRRRLERSQFGERCRAFTTPMLAGPST